MERVDTKPRGWAHSKIGEIFNFIGGGTPSKQEPSYWDGDICWASVKDVKGEYLFDTRDKITVNGVENSATNIAYPGDVILITRISPGKIITTRIETAINQDLKIVKPLYDADQTFVRYYFQSIERQIIRKASGTTVLGITLNNLNELEIYLPPLPEQHRIVAKIEELFSELDKGVENLKLAQQQLKVYRQAVLKAAFEGKLTDDEFEYIRLENLTELITKGSSPRWQGFDYIQDETQLLFITSENVRENWIDISKPKYLDLRFNEVQRRSVLQPGDVLFNIVGASIGRAAVFCLSCVCNINQAVCVIRTNKDISHNYLSLFLNSEIAKREYLHKVVDVARANLSLTDVANLNIPFVAKLRQEVIVAEIESRLSVCDKLEETIKHSLIQAESLRQSILKKAFAGELVPQDPNDEPAEKLLERIRAERSAQAPVKKNAAGRTKKHG